jgi:hypothetical protein
MRSICFIVLFFICGITNAQVEDNFNDGDITVNPTWMGDVNNFKVDDAKSLRLNAPDAGQSFLYVPVNISDSFVYEMDIKLEFSPSASNLLKIYLLTDKVDLSTCNGYVINIGENGSTDAVRFLKIENGGSTLITSGKEGAMSLDPSQVKLKITYKNNGFFNVEADYDLNGSYEDNFSFFDSGFLPSQAKYFGIQCTYSATRKDKFVFDNFKISEFKKDITPPNLTKVSVINDKQILLEFDEIVETSLANNSNNYSIVSFGKPESAIQDLQTPTNVLLTFSNSFVSEKDYEIIVAEIKDLSNNSVKLLASKFSYIAPAKIELVISEILFDPYVNQVDFVELYNPTEKAIELKGVRIKNFTNGQEKTITSNHSLKSKSYLALSLDLNSLKTIYTPIAESNLISNDLPAFNNDYGNVSVVLPDNTIIDSFNYNFNYHLFINDSKVAEGVSLEKINLLAFVNDRANWHSASKAVKYATPGYANSNITDKTAPTILRYEIISADKILLEFDDVLTRASVENNLNFNVNNGVGSPLFSDFDGIKTNIVLLTFAQPFNADRDYILDIQNISDKNNNIIAKTTINFGFGLSPEPGQLVISEILFNPNSDGVDFVELYNTTSKSIELKDVAIRNQSNNQEKKITKSYVLPAMSHIAISMDVESQRVIYNTPDTARLLQNSLPAFNTDKGNVTIKNKKGIVLDSFDYSEDLHQLLFDKSDVKGVSLEKVQLTPFNNNKSNWHSAAKGVNYATPGYTNSNSAVLINSKDEFFINKKTFSPNGDASDDLLIVGYNVPEPGYIANIEVFSSEGYKVKNLAKNELLGTNGIITWDGTNDDGNIERVGIYILKGSIYNTIGEVKYFKKECVLANFID